MYTLIAYKPSCEYCQDKQDSGRKKVLCESDISVHASLSFATLIEMWGRYLYDNSLLDIDEVGWACWILENNKLILDDDTIMNDAAIEISKQALDNMKLRKQSVAQSKAKVLEHDEEYQI